MIAAVLAAAVGAAACSGGNSQGTAPTAAGPRPTTTAKLAILAPENGQVVTGDSTKVRLSLEGARIVPQTTTKIRPDEGHVHLSLDGQIVSMNYGLEDTIGVKPGQHVMRAEFVAGDHLPFEPRLFVEVVFQVER